MEAFVELRDAGKIRFFGVSNFDVGDMEDLWRVPGGPEIATNQILYNLTRRGAEWALLPWLRKHRVPVMAYSPVEQGRLLNDRKLTELARACHMTPAQIALQWLLANDDVIVIPKTGSRERLTENLGALERPLTPEQLAGLNRLFPPPKGPASLDML